MRRLALLLAAFLLACAPFAPAPPQPGAPEAAAPGPTEPPPPRMLEGAELVGALPPRADLVACGERLCWRASSGPEYPILRARERDWLELGTELGALRSSWGLLAPSNTDPLRDLPEMLANAKAAGLRAEELVFYEEELSGGYLVGPHLYVLREGVLREIGRSELAAKSRKEHARARERVERAVAALVESLPHAKLEPESRPAVAAILAQIPLEDAQTNLDYVPPSFARRLVRFGWLSVLGAPAGPCEELRRAVLEAEKLRPVARYTGRDSTFELVEDAYGVRVWTLATPRRVGYSRVAEAPAYYTNGKSTRLVVRLPRGADPLRDAARYESAELYASADRLAAWDPERGLAADDATWRSAFPTKGEGVEWAALPDALPPHVLVTAPNGDVLALATRFGVLHPAKSGAPADAEKFYAEAARALPDAPHLDLIGEYLLVYAFDSPDPRNPALLGTRLVSGDIHQTGEQTLATTTGGMMRGDCDDLSELDQEITERQGRNAQMIGLPAHAALAWAEKQPDGSWITYILQTGQPLSFPGATLPDSLELTYKSFGSSELFDRTKLEILLRFSGENTRSSWYLSWRIFADPEYARTMIDVQRDWHFQTYQRAIVKMNDLVASGDQDPANYTELAGLYHYTGQYQLAADALVEAIARTSPGQTRVSMAIDRVVALASAGKKDEARALARELREHEIPELEDTMGLRLAEAKLSLADAVMVENCAPELALEILANDVTPETNRAIDTLVESLKKKDIDMESWRLQTEPVRDRLRWYVSSSIALLFATRDGELADSAARAVLTGTSLRWLNELGFRELDPAETPLSRYAVLGRLLEATSDPNDVLAKIEAAPLPADPKVDHAQRRDGPEQLARDFSFIRISPAFWSSELAALFAKEKKELDPARVVDLARRAAQSRDEADSLGLDHRSFEHELREIRLVTALVSGDEPKLRAELRYIKQENDRRIRMNAASWIATVARFQTVPRFARIVEIWREEVDYKPMWFWIAWNAALAGATDHALLVARTAAREFRDDRAFVEEYQFMQRRFNAPQAGGTPQRETARPRRPPESLRRRETTRPQISSATRPVRPESTRASGWP
jgi:tetratricopeptide (TPR) repeat protein